MGMVWAFDFTTLRLDHARQAAQRSSIQSRTFGHSDLGCYPKLCLAVCAHDVDMERLSRIALVRVEEKAKAIMAENGWHVDRLRGILGCGNGGSNVSRLRKRGFHPPYARCFPAERPRTLSRAGVVQLGFHPAYGLLRQLCA